MQRAAMMAKCGVPMMLQTHVEDNDPDSEVRGKRAREFHRKCAALHGEYKDSSERNGRENYRQTTTIQLADLKSS